MGIGSLKDKNLVSIIMSAYNASAYIQEAIDSVINQSYTNWELIVIDDGSTDSTASIIKKNVSKDHRIKYLYQENAKQSKARNLGISHAKGKYVAILDSDDISHPERLIKQVAFLESKPDVVLCGSWFSMIGSNRIIKCPEKHDEIKVALLNGNCIAHSSVMMRKEVLNELPVIYDLSKEPSEDYDLYARLVTKGKLHNLQEVLLNYRIHNSQLSKKFSEIQIKNANEIKRSLFDVLELELLPTEELVLKKILDNGNGIKFNDIYILKQTQVKLLDFNREGFFEPLGFKSTILNFDKTAVKSYFIKRNQFTPRIYLEYLKVKNELNFKLSVKDELKLVLKSLIFYKKR
ncbi:glycosyltransferase family 2 protein [Flavobacteriaceae bacterium XHP0103]|uniref:glycosyltransferase family 2 protein n=1 Tax=Marixanthotalea marina TaxID=2844359 RepID=UPI002989CC69|nr:glycosyltransferase family A protein [Marixanthotalea marina]MBU3822746.1 glycosyltransferase family 2 protein [Marixanthotalea marina]